ncbi:MAG: transcription-repair coupling factor [Tenericutes bacterium]|nr:transcription-repair coupling factor [Mycoplasmatota bacterium]
MINDLFKNIDFDQTDIFSGLNTEGKALLVNTLFKKYKSITIVTNTLFEANKLYQSISNYNDNVLLFPMDDFLTSEAIAISPELKINRLETLNELCNSTHNIVITNLMGYLRFLPTLDNYKKKNIFIKKDEDISFDDLIKKLVDLGYTRETIVNKTGEFSVRGFVIDIFPISFTDPIRVEFWGDTVDKIKFFNTNTQRTTKEIKDITIYPNTEFLVEKEIDKFLLKQKDLPLYTDTTNISSFFNSIVIFDDFQQLQTSYDSLLEEMMNYSISNNVLGNTVYMNDFYDIKNNKELYFNQYDDIIKNKTALNFNFKNVEFIKNDKTTINSVLNTYNKKYILILCMSDRYKVNKLIDYLENPDIVFTDENNILNDKINIIIKKMNQGFIYDKYAIITENDIYGSKSEIKYKNKFRLGTKIRNLNKLDVGDYVVHEAHGIGKYCGLKTLTKNGFKKDYLMVSYKDDDKLYIPVEKIDFISKYSAKDGIVPKLNKLGGTEWQRTKLKARKRIQDMAGELLKLYAIRETTKGFAFLKDTKEQYEFEEEFPYTETEDQLKAIEEIKKDMEKDRPMDRLLCGDVGYGKTEVAFRAIFKAIMSGKQVALLCPTTILSNQHFNNAIERFKAFPINIEMLNRFVPTKKVNVILERLKEGKVDLLIGTHRILSNDVIFKDLGLLVIDEEQRFGVTHKEKIKKYKDNVDVLTLSATPIPRTLQMSMSGLRNLSLIETPPVDRFPVQTYVLSENNQIIKDAIYKELSRDGQCFLLFNHVQDLESKKNELQKLVPDAKIICAHGKMTKTQLEDIMNDFINKVYDVLLCTTIIETGIDIPNVNTLIVYDADKFGLSQLYQLRGRVGRTNKIAYCYLMYNKSKILSEIAVKRLNSIKEFTELGSGFAIAMRDLSIRGAGDILGSEQAGFIDTIGIEMFMQMLDNEIKRLKGIEVEERQDYTPLINVETAIEDNYIPDNDIKIEIHKKINQIDSYNKLNEVKDELIDRFGKLDESILAYMYEELFEKKANELKINKIIQTKNFIEVYIPKEITDVIDGSRLFVEISKISRMFRFSMRNKQLIIILDTVKLDKHFIFYLNDLLDIIKKNI